MKKCKKIKNLKKFKKSVDNNKNICYISNTLCEKDLNFIAQYHKLLQIRKKIIFFKKSIDIAIWICYNVFALQEKGKMIFEN